MSKTYEIRDPIHGFIPLSEWEWDIINHPVFQRLRKIKQLGLTDMVYPGACHTRFEHSLGVMHVASLMFDHIVKKSKILLINDLDFNDAGLEKDKCILKIACLLHDVGHSPFSHASEELFGFDDSRKTRYSHEQYSSAIIRFLMKEVIEKHPINNNYGIKAEDIAKFIEGDTSIGRSLIWRNILSSQIDADRADYLLRDSLHIGVAYGHFDLHRIINSLSVVLDNNGSPVIAIDEDSKFVAESLVIARYLMFNQVYFHRTRRAYDHHLSFVLKEILKDSNSLFPPPTSEKDMTKYIELDDWFVYSRIKDGSAGEHGEIIKNRLHYRSIFETGDLPEMEEIEKKSSLISNLSELFGFEDCASSSWYKFSNDEIPILMKEEHNCLKTRSLSELSDVVKGLKASQLYRIYVSMDNREGALKIIRDFN